MPDPRDDILARPFTIGDAPALHAAVRGSLASLSYWFPWCHPDYCLADAEARVADCIAAWERRTEFAFGIFDAGRGELLGCTGLSRIDHDQRSANLGYWVGERHRGRGIATRAAFLAATIGFEDLELARLEIVVLPHNLASLRVAAKLGAAFEGEVRDRLVFHGEPAVALVHSLTPDGMAAKAGL